MDDDMVDEDIGGENSDEEMDDIFGNWPDRNTGDSNNDSAEPDIDSDDELVSIAFVRKQKAREARRHWHAPGTIQGNIEMGRNEIHRRGNLTGSGAAVADNDIDSGEDLLSAIARARRQKAPEVRRRQPPSVVPKASMEDYDSESASNYEPDDETGSEVSGDGSRVSSGMISSRQSELGPDIDFNSDAAILRDVTGVLLVESNMDIKTEIKLEGDD